MEMSPQFEQQELFPRHEAETHPIFQPEQQALFGRKEVAQPRFMPHRAEDMPESPFQQRKRVSELPDTPEIRQQRVDNGEHPVDVYHGGTYPMLMTGMEVRNQFQALDGDRMDAMNDENSWTASAARTATHTTQRPDMWGMGVTYHQGSRLPARREYDSSYGPESDDQLYDRKYQEADEDGLVDSVHEMGFNMRHPVSLSTGQHWWGTTGGTGDQGKFQVLGGHHRIAVMSQDFPRQFMSVRWHPDIYDAQAEVSRGGNY